MSDFVLIRKKVKSISIKIKFPQVIVVAPKNISLEYINKLLISKADWIEKTKKFCERKKIFFDRNNFLDFSENETILFLGKNDLY